MTLACRYAVMRVWLFQKSDYFFNLADIWTQRGALEARVQSRETVAAGRLEVARLER